MIRSHEKPLNMIESTVFMHLHCDCGVQNHLCYTPCVCFFRDDRMETQNYVSELEFHDATFFMRPNRFQWLKLISAAISIQYAIIRKAATFSSDNIHPFMWQTNLLNVTIEITGWLNRNKHVIIIKFIFCERK